MNNESAVAFADFFAILRTRKNAGVKTVARLREELLRIIALGASEDDEHERDRLQNWAREIADLIFRFTLEYPNALILPVVHSVSTPEMGENRPRLAVTRITHIADELFGRYADLARLDAAWADPKINVVTVVAWGGVGKTSLVATWASLLATRDYDGADYFDWSFYSQGTREEGSATGAPFITAALGFFGGTEGERMAASATSARDKGAKLASYLGNRRALLILDGLEPLQYPPSSPLAGQLKDEGIAAFLIGLARKNPGLCVVTTRESVADLAAYREKGTPEWKLDSLSTTAGVALLEKLEIRGKKEELEQLVEDVGGHALTLNLLGRFLRDAHGGDVLRRNRVDLRKADEKTQGGHAFRAIEAYEKWLGSEKGEGTRQLAVLRLLGFFDRPADGGCLATLRREPVITGLTDPLVGIEEGEWNFAVSKLVGCGLVSRTTAREGSSSAEGLDSHPLVREYFAREIRERAPEAWEAAHQRLFEYFQDLAEYQPTTLEGLQPLYRAVYHGCLAGKHEEACVRVYQERILRGQEAYSVTKLGAYGADLGAITSFFEIPWIRVSANLEAEWQAWLLNEAAQRLRALGRLTEALEPMKAGLAMRIQQGAFLSASRIAANLSELELALGDIPAAVRDGEQSVIIADRGVDLFERISDRTTLADALHQAGRRSEARSHFNEAERMQSERQPKYPKLHVLLGFRFCDLLLAEAEIAAWRGGKELSNTGALLRGAREVEARARQTLDWLEGEALSTLSAALDHLTIGRAKLFRSILGDADLAPARLEVEHAMDGLRRTGHNGFIVGGLLTRAWLFSLEGDLGDAHADLDEVEELATRGPMPLFLADVHLYRARLFGDRSELQKARSLIEKHGYGRRLEELSNAEVALAVGS